MSDSRPDNFQLNRRGPGSPTGESKGFLYLRAQRQPPVPFTGTGDEGCPFLRTFEKYGGIALVGKSLMDCHPEPARRKLREIMTTQKPNCYTIEKEGCQKAHLSGTVV